MRTAKLTQQAIRDLIANGAIHGMPTFETAEQEQLFRQNLSPVARSMGVNGKNGGIWKDKQDGALYGLADRSSDVLTLPA